MRDNHNNERRINVPGGMRAIRSVLDRFPGYWSEIKALGSQQGDFRELCDEYSAARSAVDYWSGSDDDDALRHAAEYVGGRRGAGTRDPDVARTPPGRQDEARRVTGYAQIHPRLQVIAAASVLGIGLLVYFFDRSAVDLAFIPGWWRFADGTPELFGALGGSFPSFAHTFCFAILIAALVGPWGVVPWQACVAWGAVEAALEVAQLPYVANSIAGLLPAWFADWPHSAEHTHLFRVRPVRPAGPDGRHRRHDSRLVDVRR